MSFNAGEISAQATLDLSPFRRSVTQLRADIRRLANEKFTAKLGADTGEGDAKILAFKRSLGSVDSTRVAPKIGINTVEADRRLALFNGQMDQVARKITSAKIRLDGDDVASRRLEDLELRLKRIGLINARPRVSVQGVASAELQLEGLSLQLDRLDHRVASVGGGGGRGGILGALSGAGSHAPKFSLRNLLIGAAPMAAPVAGLAAGAASSLLTPIVAGGIGGGLFAKATESTYKGLQTTIKSLTADQKAYNNAVTSKTRATALEKEKRDWAALGPQQKQAVTNVHKMSTEWADFQRKLRPQSFGLIATGTDIARKALHLLLPDAKAAGNEIDDLAKKADAALSQPFWKDFFTNFLPGQTHQALKTLGTDLGDAATGLANLTEKFAPLGNTLEQDMVKWGAEFERWTEGSGPSKFVSWVQKNGPGIAHDLGDVAKGIAGVGKSLLPFGTGELRIIGDIANGLGSFSQAHPTVVKDLGEALLVVGTGLKAIKTVGSISSTVSDLSALAGLGKGGALRKVLAGGGGICGCGPGGPGVSGPGRTVARDAEDALDIGTGGAIAKTLLGKIGGRGTNLLGKGLSIGELGAGLGAYWLSGFGIPNGLPKGTVGVDRSGQALSAAGFAKEYPLASAFGLETGKSKLFPQFAAAVGSGKIDEGTLFGNTLKGGYDLSKVVGSIVGQGNTQQLANLKQLAAVYPTVQKAIDGIKGAQAKLNDAVLQSSTRLHVVQQTVKSLSDAESNMGTVAAQVGGKITGSSRAATLNRAAFKSAADQVQAYREHLIETGAPMDQVVTKTRSYAASLVNQAKDLYNNSQEVDRLAKKFGILPSQITTKIAVDPSQAFFAIQRIHHWLDTLHNKTISVYTRQQITTTGYGQHGSVNTQDSAPVARHHTAVASGSHLGRAIAPHHLPIPNLAGGHPLPLNPTSSGSHNSGGGSRGSGSGSRSSGISPALVNNVISEIHQLLAAGLQVSSADRKKALAELSSSTTMRTALDTLQSGANIELTTLRGLATHIKSQIAQTRANMTQLRQTDVQSLTQNTMLSGITLAQGSGSHAASTIVGGVTTELAKEQRFIGLLDRLRKAKLNTDDLRQILAMGPDAGIPYAQALLSNAGIFGGTSAVSLLNSEQGKVNRLANRFGSADAQATYGSKLDRQTAHLATIVSEEKQQTKLLRELSTDIGHEIKDENAARRAKAKARAAH